MILKEACERFLRHKKNPSTHRNYETILKHLQKSLGADRDVRNLTRIDFDDYDIALSKHDWSEAWICLHRRCVKALFNWLVEMEVIPSNPAKPLKGSYTPKPNRDRAMTDEELEAVLSVVRWNPRNHAVVMMLADTGCRAGGLASLLLKNIFLDQGCALVTEKGGKTRKVWFGPETRITLAEWMMQRPTCPHNFCFCAVRRYGHRPLSSDAIYGVVNNACRVAGIRRLGPHSLRHRKGFQMADARLSAATAQDVLGHERVTTTLESYYPRDEERARDAVLSLAITSDQVPARKKKDDHVLPFSRQS
jgi:integrase